VLSASGRLASSGRKAVKVWKIAEGSFLYISELEMCFRDTEVELLLHSM
jgi:hypothetical protein